MTKPEELEFIVFVLSHSGAIPLEFWKDLTKRQYAWLDKWDDKGWWEYGVSLRAGWLTPQGLEELAKKVYIKKNEK